MATSMVSLEARLNTYHECLYVDTHESLEFTDITERLAACVHYSGIRDGFVNVQTRHTTTAILVGEHRDATRTRTLSLELRRWLWRSRIRL